ncbi:uncharacterized protein KNAG_0A03200 [Huiozyma naganishii CBS 8797]|uniref:YEATS domain-containing protein n=1 Tax=Huiozyma naganishii (strain ATCC MYA-139 / BCRC 22969 / CBS 8797 / KCTC 17520 / NBRC 10181 / NCYC 3082 / Yp74L-3) TaxID=1071383 RepID=J7RTG4_HUIN7|nr:hypothetical protein KNAG_0A03200 [Kazachstania naganishii CBS 8797]CCK68007.1 hypothetical protein KNAG_0A03200 [Kazachstania naganishii CBS 8797]
MREWSIEIVGLNSAGEEVPLTLVDKIVYHLHPTFVKPNRTFTEPPFTISEQGWGGFALNISLWLKDKGGERKVTHDLNFLKDEYQVDHVIQVPVNISKPSLLEELRKTGDDIPTDEELASSGAVNTKRKSVSAAADPTGTTGEPKAKKPKAAATPMVRGGVDVEMLAFGLTKMKDIDLVEIVHKITENVTSEMNVTNNVEDGELTLDLFSLPDSLLKDLWTYVNEHIEKQ